MLIFLCPSSSQRSHGSGAKIFLDFDLFCPHRPPNPHPNRGLWPEWTNVIFFGPITKPVRWRFQGGGKQAIHRAAAVTKIALSSLCDSVSWASNVKMRHFKRQKSSSWCGQCREWMWEGPTPSGWSGKHQEGSVSWAICAHLASFGCVFSQECLPNNWTGCSDYSLVIY